MNSFLKLMGACALSCMLVGVASAADEKAKGKKGEGKGRAMAGAQLLKLLEPVGLTEDQVAKIKELGKATAEQMQELRTAGLTQELQKKRGEAMKAAREAGKSGKEAQEAINASLSDEEKELLAKANAITSKMRKDAMALLTDEQKAKLPARKGGKGGDKKGAKDGEKKGAKDGAKKAKDSEGKGKKKEDK